MGAVLALFMFVMAMVLASKLSALKARFMRLEPHLEAILTRIATLEKALAALEAKPVPEGDDASRESEEQAYHARWRAAAAANPPTQIVSEPVSPPEPEPAPAESPDTQGAEDIAETLDEAEADAEALLSADSSVEAETIASEPDQPDATAQPAEPAETVASPDTAVEAESVPDSVEPPAVENTQEHQPNREPEPARIAEPVAAEMARPSAPEPRFSFPKISISFEELVGGKLPIWVGGIALILAGFFLVSYSYEQGYLGPPVQCIAAALFGLILLIGSEVGKRVTKIADDPRVGQALAGAGIAVLYGTVYMTRYVHDLITPTQAMIIMAAVTVAALGLSLRHGPPTAFMGLVGGFVAPFFSLPEGNLAPVLVYLGLLIAGLFALSVHRGWRWLAILATGGGFFWSLGIMLADMAGIGAALGAFIVLIALAATLLFPKSGIADARAQMVPMIVGFIQLAIFAPKIQFDLTGWVMYGLLSAAALFLGWRDRKLMPVTVPALGLVLVLLAGAFGRASELAPWVALAITILFALPGHLLARRGKQTDPYWTALAIGGGIGPLLIAYLTQGRVLLPDTGWGVFFALAALPQALLSWRARDEGKASGLPDWALFGGGVAAGAMAMLAMISWTNTEWAASAAMAITIGIALWARRTGDNGLFNASLGFAVVAAFLWLGRFVHHGEVFNAIILDGAAPAHEIVAALLVFPAILTAALAWIHSGRLASHILRWTAMGLALALPLALVPQDWHAVACLGFATIPGLWARKTGHDFAYHASIAAVLVGLVYWATRLVVHQDVVWAVIGNGAVPPVNILLNVLIIPGALVGLLSWCHAGRASHYPLRWMTLWALLGLGLALVAALWHPVMALTFAAALSVLARVLDDKFCQEASFTTMTVAGLYWLSGVLPHPELFDAIFSDGMMPEPRVLVALLAGPAALFAIMPWGNQGKALDQPLRWLTLGFATGLVLAILPFAWQPAALAAIAGLALIGGGHLPLPRFAAEALLGLTGLYLIQPLMPFAQILLGSFVGIRVHYGLLASVAEMIQMLALPALVLSLTAWARRDRISGTLGNLVFATIGLTATAVLYGLAKQPLAIATDAQFTAWGLIERAAITQVLFVIGLLLLWRGSVRLRSAAWAVVALALLRFGWFDLLTLNPVLVAQNVGGLPVINAATLHYGLITLGFMAAATLARNERVSLIFKGSAILLTMVTLALTVRQLFHHAFLNTWTIYEAENYGYSAAFLLLAIVWLWRGIAGQVRWLRLIGFVLLTIVTAKVFLFDARELRGLYRVFSFMGLGATLMVIGWAYNRFVRPAPVTEP